MLSSDMQEKSTEKRYKAFSISEDQKKQNKKIGLQRDYTFASLFNTDIEFIRFTVFLFSRFSELDIFIYACRSEKTASSSY